MDILKSDKDFKEAVGAFIIAFSELEFGLGFLCSMTEFDLRHKDSYIPKYLGLSFEQKIRHLSEFIDSYLSEISQIWGNIKMEIGVLNRERRFFAHRFMSYSLPHESITTHVKEKGQIVTKRQTLEEIKSYINRIHHLNTGKNGINGEFHTLFTKARVNKWYSLVNDEAKIVYRVNGAIISDWKG